MNLKRQTFIISGTDLAKKERMTIFGNLSLQRRKYFLLRKYHVTLTHTKAVTYSSYILVQLSFSKINSLLSATTILSRSSMAYNTTASLEKLTCTDYVDFGMSQDRFWTIFLGQKWLQLLGYWTKRFQTSRRKCRNSTETKLYNGRSWFLSFCSTKKPTSCCIRQLSQRTKFVAGSSIYTVQRHGRAAEACSQGEWHCGLHNQKDLFDTVAIQGEQPRDLRCSSSSTWTEEGGRKNSTNCVCQLKISRVCVSSWRHEFGVW